MNGVRKPHVRRLLRIHQPWSLVPRLDVGVNQSGFCLTLADLVRMAAGAFFHRWHSSKRAVIAKCMALTAIQDAGLLRMRFVSELHWLLFLHIQHPRKRDP